MNLNLLTQGVDEFFQKSTWGTCSQHCETYFFPCVDMISRILKGGGGVQGEGVFLGNPKDSVWEDWGFLREH